MNNRYETATAPVLHILRPRGHYIGQVRRAGYQKWETVTDKHRSARHALAEAILKGKWRKRARVLFIDSSPYYDPHVVMEARLA